MEPFGNKNQNWAAAQAIQQQAALMANGAQSALAAQQQMILQQSGLAGAGQRVFTGTITKMHDNFGFVDNDVFFQLNVCEGQLVPSVGDSVLVKAQYNAAMPFKWNATSVQVIMKQGQQQQGSKRFSNQQQGGRIGGGNRQNFGNRQQNNRNSTGGGILGAAPTMINQSSGQQRNQKRNAPPPKPKTRRSPVRSESSTAKETKRKRSRSKSTPRKRSPSAGSRSKDRRRSPVKTATKRYTVKSYKYPLVSKSGGLLDLNTRYKSMYIPSDFTESLFHWQDCFSLDNQYITNPCHFQVLNKDVEAPAPLHTGQLHPEDADSSWIARVMLLHISQRSDVYKDCCGLTQDNPDKFIHPSRMYKFLLGYKGKKEVMAIGGLWSPSLDGPNPQSNPQTLIKTAIRTCKELTGIDLSSCTKWYRMLEVRYHRDEEGNKDRRKPERIQTTVIYLPDVHNCMPGSEEYTNLRDAYMNKFTDKYINKTMTTVAEPTPQEECDITDKDAEMAEGNMTVVDESKGDSDEDNEDKPTHYSELDLKSMKVDLLRHELKCRGLETKGLKSQLVVRLQEAVDDEKAKEESKEEEEDKEESKEEEKSDDAVIELDVPENDDKITHKDEEKKETKDEDEKKEDEKLNEEDQKQKEMDELELKKIKKRYILSSRRSILVHPNSAYKKGTFDCQLTSLHSLLDYVMEDKKESMFEVYLFAECFNEMLSRDHAFNIYKALKHPVKLPTEEPAETGSKRKSETDENEPKNKKSKEDDDNNDEEEDEKMDSKDEEDEKKEESKEKSDKDKTEKESTAKIEKVVEKQVTVRKNLLLSFVYFDQSHAGYIRENDLIDIINSIGLNLSRSQISKLLSSSMEHGKLMYRKLTDCDESKVEQMEALEEDVYEKINTEDLIGGNKFLMKTADVNINDDQSCVVSFKGTTIDVEAMMTREKLNDKARNDLEVKNHDLKDKLSKLQSSFDKTQKDLVSMQDECKEIGQKLTDTRSEVSKLTTTKDNYSKIFTGMKKLVTEAGVEGKAD